MYNEVGTSGGTSFVSSQSPSINSRHSNHNTRRDTENSEDPERVPFLQTCDWPPPSDADESSQHIRVRSAFSVTIAASLLILIIDVVASVPVAPRIVIFEEIICRNHYAAWGADLRLSDCKITPVQNELALLNGWRETFDMIPGLLVSVPYGALADRIGRKKVLVLALIGCLFSDIWVAIVCLFPQTFPLRAIWVSGLWQLIGGGGASVVSMCFTLIGDVCSAEQRTTAFSQVHAAVLLSELISIPLGSSLISVDPWIPVLGALGFMAMTIVFGLIFTPNFGNPYMKLQCPESDEVLSDLPSAPSGKIRDRLSQTMTKLVDSCQWITMDVLLMLGAFFVCQLSRQVSGILLQYSSFKFNWEYAKVTSPILTRYSAASYLISLRAGVNLLVLFTVVPALTRFLINQWRCRQTQADKYITSMSGLCLVIGSIFIFLAASPFALIIGQIFFAIGFAFTVTARSFLTAMVDQRHLGLLYTSVTAVTYAGFIVGGPLLASAFQWGLYLGGFWVGIPFLVTAILFLIATLAVSAAKAP
ncbi:MFS multidrug transporter [Penicillium fimorum]|uniref:MFS multidrug transporter n=1 Tax=Penicillium fimorum TaxID=1882269 RepID=A0A9W9XTW9_9EURO|nr:MFS multidrug transporter [Penicillium fimorum]